MHHCTTLIVELETRERHVEHFNNKYKGKPDTQRCKWSKEITNFFITFINKTIMHNCNEIIL